MTQWKRVFGLLMLSSLILVLAQCIPQPAKAALWPTSKPFAPTKYRSYLKRTAFNLWGFDAPTSAFAAQIHQESAWNPLARSRVGARGLTQFMPSTEEWFKTIYPAQLAMGGSDSPYWAIRAQILYNRWLWHRVEGLDDCERMAFTFSAYNGGLGWVHRRKALSEIPDICLGATCTINPGILPSNQFENERYSYRILMRLEPRFIAENWGPGACWDERGLKP